MNDTRNVIKQALELLPAQQKEVYRLCHQEGLKYEEAALRLNISVNTVQTHMSRALKFLRTHLKNNTDIVAVLIVMKLF
ncbi:RNA polymerase sigma factor [compost metagenome]